MEKRESPQPTTIPSLVRTHCKPILSLVYSRTSLKAQEDGRTSKDRFIGPFAEEQYQEYNTDLDTISREMAGDNKAPLPMSRMSRRSRGLSALRILPFQDINSSATEESGQKRSSRTSIHPENLISRSLWTNGSAVALESEPPI